MPFDFISQALLSAMAAAVYAFVVLLVVVLAIQQTANSVRIARLKRKHGCQPVNRIPQPERIIGWQFFKIQLNATKNKNVLETGRRRYQEYGQTWSVSMMGQTFYNTIDVENLKTILATNFKHFGLGGRLEAFGPLLGKGIFTTDGKQWEHSRAIVRPNFTRAQVADLDTFETHIKRMISKIPTDGSTVDLQKLFFQLTLDSATEFLFGDSVNSLISTEASEQERFGKAFDLAQSRLGNRSRMGKLSYLFRDREFDEACQTVHEFVDKIVYTALEKSQPHDAEKIIDGNGQQPERYVFLTELLKTTRDPMELRHELLNILLAGRDTTASLLSNTFHVLARRSDIWKKLKAEVDELNGQKPDYETLRNQKYLKYLLNESLRLYPVVPSNARFAIRDTTLPRGGGPDGTSPLFIPSGSIIAYHTYNLHRRTDIYGSDALDFRPERWGPEENLRPGWGYLPFNGGPRICVGQQFALTEASYTIVRLVQEFEGMEDRDGRQWVEQLSLTMASANGVRVGMIPR